MKLRNLVIAFAALGLAACGGTPEQETDTTATEIKTTTTTTEAEVKEAATKTVTAVEEQKVAMDVAPNFRIFFDFDDATVKSNYEAAIVAVSAYMKANPNSSVTVVGNADERGTNEYNMALGYKRAQSVVRALAAEGVDPKQLSADSLGETNPLVVGHDESAWKMNRRAEFTYQ